MKFERIAGIVTFAAVAAGVAAGFATTGPPQHMRLVELDRQRIADLRSVAYDLNNGDNGRGMKRLPERLSGTHDPSNRRRDPVTGAPYEYHRDGALRYRLCATFALPSDPAAEDTAWRHDAGRQCFRFEASGPVEPLPEPSPTSRR